jgi:hypothetical protein
MENPYSFSGKETLALANQFIRALPFLMILIFAIPLFFKQELKRDNRIARWIINKVLAR